MQRYNPLSKHKIIIWKYHNEDSSSILYKTGNTKKLADAIAVEAGVNLSRKEYHYRVEFQMPHKEKPDEADIKAVRDFAEAIVELEEK